MIEKVGTMRFTRILPPCLLILMQVQMALGATCAFNPASKIEAAQAVVVVAEGDSITSGVGSSDGKTSYASLASTALRAPATVTVKALSQSVLGWTGGNAPQNSLYSRMQADAALIPKDKQGKVYILSILIGRNDLVGYYGGLDQYLRLLTEYVSRMRQAGWDRIVLGTLIASEWPAFEPVRNAFNDRVKSPCWANEHGIDAIADFGGIPQLNSTSAASQRTYFADGIHPNDAGYAAMAPVYAEAVNSLTR